MFLTSQFLLINGNFVINLLAALVCFAVSWLHYDAWVGRKDTREGTKALGFILLSVSFVVQSTVIEQALLSSSLIGEHTSQILITIFRSAGYLVLIIGQLLDPLQTLPDYRIKSSTAGLVVAGSMAVDQWLKFSFPLLGAVTAFMYLRRATLGLEHHLKPISWSLFALTASELFSQGTAFRDSSNVFLAKLVAPFGTVWLIEKFFVLMFLMILGRWVWSYLIRRLETQLLMIFTTTTLGIFLITTLFFTTASMNSLRNGALENLKINVNVLGYSIDSKKAEILSDAQVIAQNPEVITAVLDKNRSELVELTTTILLAKQQTFLVVVDGAGKVLARADDPEKVGGSLSDDPLVQRALEGDGVTGVVTREGVMAPEVSVRGAVPIETNSGVVGAVMVGTSIDNAFVDGLKKATGLDASIYADNIRSATTFVASDGKSRWVGIKEETKKVKKTVLADGEIYTGSVSILNVPYYAAFAPLNNVSGTPIGMLFVGSPQVALLQSASESIELTFLVTAIMLVASIVPAYFVSKYIIAQIR